MSRYQRRSPNLPDILPVEIGGTSAQTPSTARVQLDMLSESDLGQPGGVALVNQQNKLDKSIFLKLLPFGDCVSGSSSVFVNTPAQFEITDFDSFTPYTVTTTKGSVTRVGNMITYTPSGVTGPGGFTLNGRDVNLTILPPTPKAPVITTPVNNSAGLNAKPLIVTEAFQVLAGTDTHLATDWQIASDANFTTIIQQSLMDGVNKTNWTPLVALLANTSYYLRVRHHGETTGPGPYSSVVKFTTKVEFFPYMEEAVIPKFFTMSAASSEDGKTVVIGSRNMNGVGQNYPGFFVYNKDSNGVWSQTYSITKNHADHTFGAYCAVSADGKKIITLHSNGPMTDAGRATAVIYTYTKTNGVWVEETPFVTDRNSYPAERRDTATSEDLTRVAYCGYKNGATNANRVVVVRIYAKSGNSWVGEANIDVSLADVISAAATSIVMSADGNVVAVSGAHDSYGIVNTYIRNGSSWSALPEIRDVYQNFASDVSLNYDGTLLVVGSISPQLVNGKKGAAFIYRRGLLTNGVMGWTLEATIENPVNTTTGSFGQSVKMNKDGTKIMVSDPSTTVNGFANAGTIYTYTYSPGAAVAGMSFPSQNPETNMQFGSVIRANDQFSLFTPTTIQKTWIYG